MVSLRGAPYTYVTDVRFPVAFDLESFQDMYGRGQVEDAGPVVGRDGSSMALTSSHRNPDFQLTDPRILITESTAFRFPARRNHVQANALPLPAQGIVG